MREIGRGGMGIVYEAEQVSLRRPVALKILPAFLALVPGSVDRFRREALAAAHLDHPGVVQVFSVGEDEGIQFIAMELVEGASLDRLLAELEGESLIRVATDRLEAIVAAKGYRRGEAPATPGPSSAGPSTWKGSSTERVCRWIAQVAEALDHAHRAGVIHRDVKPANIIVRHDGQVVLTDFGLARQEGLPALTRTGDFAGTPYYVSPEQAMSLRLKVDHRTDIFSLGVTLYELLTSRRPFDGDTVREVLGKIIEEDPPDPRKWNVSIPRDLVTIVLTAMEKDPDRRYATARAFADDLRSFLEFRPIAARPPSPTRRLLKFARRNPSTVTVFFLALLLAGGGGLWWWLLPGHLEISSGTEGAVIFVDGRRRVEVTRRGSPVRIALTPGLHRVMLEKAEEDLATAEEEVVVLRGTTRILDRPLSSRNGILRLESEPAGARVTLVTEDGRKVEVPRETPALFTVRAGSYRARFVLPGFDPREEITEVRPGGALTLCAHRWETGVLAIESFQDGPRIEVFKGGRPGIGDAVAAVTTPSRLRLSPGTYSLRARRAEFDRRDFGGGESVRVEAGATANAWIWLAPVERKIQTRVEGEVLDICLGDLDGDGLPEVIAAGSSGRISVISPGREPRLLGRIEGDLLHVAAADLDGDGRAEVIATAGNLPFSRAAPGRGVVVFAPGGARLREKGVENIISLALADLDGDGGPWIVVGTVRDEVIALGRDLSVRFRMRVGGDVYHLAAADLDGDGKDEIVASVFGDGHRIIALSGDGAPRFQVVLRKSAHSLLARDLDGDGRAEIAAGAVEGLVAVHDPGGGLLYEATGVGTVTALDAGDLEGTGRRQVVAGLETGEILAFAGDGSRRFEARAGSQVIALAAIDLDGDGSMEVVAGTIAGRILVLSGDGTERFEVQAGSSVSRLAAADLDGDGAAEAIAGTRKGEVLAIAPDRINRLETRTGGDAKLLAIGRFGPDPLPVAVAAAGNGQVTGLSLRGTRRFAARVDPEVEALVLANLDGDAAPAVIAATWSLEQEGWIAAIAADGSIRFKVKISTDLFERLAALDLDGDGRDEVIAVTRSGMVVAVSGDGSKRFEAKGPQSSTGLVTPDLDGDGRREFVVSGEEGEIAAFSADGSRRGSARVLPGIHRLLAADLDGDGRDEVLAGGKGLFVLASADLTSRLCLSVGEVDEMAVADLGSDPRPEIVVGTARGILAFSPEGAPLFEAGLRGRVLRLVPVDLDGDGRAEIAAATEKGQIVALSANGSRRFEAWVGGFVSWLVPSSLAGDRGSGLLAGTRAGRILALGSGGETLFEERLGDELGCLATADLDGDGRPEIAAVGSGGLLKVWKPRLPDPRSRLRGLFHEALAAAEEGSGGGLEGKFREASLRWLTIDPEEIPGLRGRLALAGGTSAKGMAAILEARHPATPRDWLEAALALEGQGRGGGALRLVGERLAGIEGDLDLWREVAEAALGLLDSRHPLPEEADLAAALAEAAVSGDRRKDPGLLKTLAETLRAAGRRADAIAAAEEALGRCGPGDGEIEKATRVYLDWLRSDAGK